MEYTYQCVNLFLVELLLLLLFVNLVFIIIIIFFFFVFLFFCFFFVCFLVFVSEIVSDIGVDVDMVEAVILLAGLEFVLLLDSKSFNRSEPRLQQTIRWKTSFFFFLRFQKIYSENICKSSAILSKRR